MRYLRAPVRGWVSDRVAKALVTAVAAATVLLGFLAGSGVMHVDEFLDRPASLDFVLLDPIEVAAYLSLAKFEQLELIEGRPYLSVGSQSRRAYAFGTKCER